MPSSRSLTCCRGSRIGEVHKKRQSRRTRRFIGFGSRSIGRCPGPRQGGPCEKTRTLRTSAGRSVPMGTLAARAWRRKSALHPRRSASRHRRGARRGGRPASRRGRRGSTPRSVPGRWSSSRRSCSESSSLRTTAAGARRRRPTSPTYNRLPGVRKTKAPWPPEYEFLADRLPPLGLTTLPQEAVNTHYHSHLDIFVDGKKVTVPALIGINVGAQLPHRAPHPRHPRCHPHRVAEVERPLHAGPVPRGVGGVPEPDAASVRTATGSSGTSTGSSRPGNPQRYTLKSHDEIAIVVGKPPAKIPSKYAFLAGE